MCPRAPPSDRNERGESGNSVKARGLATPLVLVLLAVGTAAYAYLLDPATVSDADRAVRRSDVFPSFRVEEVSRLEIVHSGESTVLERDADAGAGSAWTLVSPRRERADPSAVDVLLRELELATRLREVGADDAVGLDHPRAQGKVQVGALQYRFALGGDAPRPEGAAYMRVDGEGTFVVDRSLKVQLMRGADTYRERALVPYGASGIGRLEVHAASGASFALEREGPTFRVVGLGLRASRSAVDELMATLADARAETFLDDAMAGGATAVPALTVTVTPRDAAGQPVVLRIGGVCPGQPDDVVVVRTVPSRVSACTARRLTEALGTTSSALVDTAPFFAHADEIEELRLDPLGRAGPRVEIARRGSGWRERSPEDRDLTSDETDSANLLALALAQARGSDVRRGGSEERFGALARVTLIRTGGERHEVVEFGAPLPDGSIPMRRDDDGATLHVSRAVARRFEAHPVSLRARPVWKTPFEAGAVISIDDSCTPGPERLELHDGSWTLRAPGGLPADAVSVADLVGSLSQIKADAWIAESDDGSFGFDGPGACAVVLTLDPGPGDARPRRITVTLGAEGDGGVYARTSDDPAVFVASSGLRQVLAHPAIDRSRIRIDTTHGASVTVVRDGVRRLLSSDGGADATLEGALAALFAESALHAGPAAPDEGLEHPTLEVVVVARTDAGTPVETRVVLGAETRVDGADSYFARVSGVGATFAVPKARVTAILDAL
jgi:hypothetical protein